MKKSYVLTYAAIAVLVVAAAAVIYWAYFADRGGSDYDVIMDAAPFELTDTEGNTVSLDNTNGKARLVYFFFSTCPDVCPPTTQVLSKVQEELKKEEAFGDETAILQITFDPENDTVERLKEFSSYFDADYSGWHFLRSDDQQYLLDLAKGYGVGVQKTEQGDYAHTNVYVLVDKEGKIRNYYLVGDRMDEIEPADIAEDMIELAKE
ncbi:SCO family protein [Marinicrinis lubricantis]|uniref:SCO family protein n=1 Tax=Marinicrinis lubricantis TaxID=2086470 RepID=A0ABW1IQT1_9BACL